MLSFSQPSIRDLIQQYMDCWSTALPLSFVFVRRIFKLILVMYLFTFWALNQWDVTVTDLQTLKNVSCDFDLNSC